MTTEIKEPLVVFGKQQDSLRLSEYEQHMRNLGRVLVMSSGINLVPYGQNGDDLFINRDALLETAKRLSAYRTIGSDVQDSWASLIGGYMMHQAIEDQQMNNRPLTSQEMKYLDASGLPLRSVRLVFAINKDEPWKLTDQLFGFKPANDAGTIISVPSIQELVDMKVVQRLPDLTVMHQQLLQSAVLKIRATVHM